ncbi:MAG: serine/threonine-protein kinase [Terriglobales bacterium]
MFDPENKDDQGKVPSLSEMVTTPASGVTGELDAVALGSPLLLPLKERYEIISELGRGGMGIVYRALDRETGDVVALKVVSPRLASEPVLADLKREMLMARKITHKHVCRTHELMRFGGISVIAMEFVEGESLRAVLSRTQGVAISAGLRWAGQICAALEEAHGQGVIHRDLKPENIIIDREGNVRVMDFGLARSLDAEATMTEGISGTPAYLSPEQAEGKPGDARSDVYSLGLILYEMFSGRRAFAGASGMALIRKQVEETPAALHQVNPHIPQFLQGIVHRCIEKDPKKRFQTAAELVTALKGGIPEITTEGMAPIPPELGRWNSADWVLAGCAGIALLYVLLASDSIVGASKVTIEVDAITARREAENLGKQWNFQLSSSAKAERVYLAEQEFSGQFSFYWRIPLAAGEGYILIDRKGKFWQLDNPVPAYLIPANYVPPLSEKRREAALQVVSQVCGPVPEKTSVIVTSGGLGGATYMASLQPQLPLNSPPLAFVELTMDRVARLNCYGPAPRPAVAGFIPRAPLMKSVIVTIAQFGIVIFILAMAVRFGIRQSHLSTKFWDRFPLAAVMAAASVWVLSRSVLPVAELAVLIVVAGASSGVFLVLIFAIEQDLLRLGAPRIASFQRLMEHSLSEPGVGFALVRGAFVGLVLVGLSLLYFQFSLWGATAAGQSKLIRVLTAFLGGYPSLDGAGFASSSFSPGIFVLASALFHGLVLGLLTPGAAWQDIYRDRIAPRSEREKRLIFPLSAGSAVVFAVIALNLSYPGGQSPGFGFFMAPLIMGIPLGWLFRRFDALTIVFAIFTYIIWSQGVPLLVILSEVGNLSVQVAFAVWLAILLAGAGIGFRQQLAGVFRNMRQPA